MKVKEIEAKSILRKYKKIDSWFISKYGMNLYRGCTHNCIYCDGRSEKYSVEGEFGDNVEVKINAIEILKKELDKNKKLIPLKKGYIMVGGGVGDSYQPVEKKYELTRKTLELLYERNHPVHILTKSTLIERDLDILKKINKKTRCIVSFSFSSSDEKISSIFEPGVPSPDDRFKLIERFKNNDLICGIFLLPVIPFVTDRKDIMENTIKRAHDVGIDFIIFGGMTLKVGRQKEYFIKTLNKYYPDLLTDYFHIYKSNKWGSATNTYYDSINKTFNVIAKYYKINRRIPQKFFYDVLYENDLVSVILEHLDYLLMLEGKRSSYRWAADSISNLKKPISSMKSNMQEIKGVGPTTERIILEILKSGSSKYYEELMNQ
jgi:DNA repair photolyase